MSANSAKKQDSRAFVIERLHKIERFKIICAQKESMSYGCLLKQPFLNLSIASSY